MEVHAQQWLTSLDASVQLDTREIGVKVNELLYQCLKICIRTIGIIYYKILNNNNNNNNNLCSAVST